MVTLQWKDLPASVRARLRGGNTKHETRNTKGRRAGGALAERVGTRFEKALFAASIGSVVTLQGLPKCGAQFVGGGKAHALPICCDFVGCVKRDGQGIFFDAKHVGRKDTGFRCGHVKVLKVHQVEFLRRMEGARAIAGILVQCERHGDFRWLAACHLEGKTVHWEDPRWIVLGATVDFAKLVAVYRGEA